MEITITQFILTIIISSLFGYLVGYILGSMFGHAQGWNDRIVYDHETLGIGEKE